MGNQMSVSYLKTISNILFNPKGFENLAIPLNVKLLSVMHSHCAYSIVVNLALYSNRPAPRGPPGGDPGVPSLGLRHYTLSKDFE